METTNQSGPVTIDDVAAACQQAGVTAGTTNASRIRIALGRGSFGTIQKHLDALRETATKAQEQTDTVLVPPPPESLLAGLWSAAYSAAGHQIGQRNAAVLAERDAVREVAAAAAADVAALANQLDELEAANLLATTDREKVIAERNAAVQSLIDHQKASDEKITAMVTAHEKSTLAAAHQAELAERDKKIERQSLQSTIDRLTDQVGELKSLLSIQARVTDSVKVGEPS